MTEFFADTSGFVAYLNAADEHHALAHEYVINLADRIVTTVWVLTELGNFLADKVRRRSFIAFVRDLRKDARVKVIPPHADLFDRGLDLYARRPDKEWSITDCISFVVMKRERLTEALTADHHFEQAGFRALLR
jgi:predicted nucleic acid-binding protein